MTVQDQGDYGPIKAVPVRHPWRWVAIFVLLVLTAKLIHLLVTNSAFDWHFITQAMIQSPVIHGLLVGTIVGSIGAMALGVVLGVLLAIMRLSENRVLSTLAWAYVWFFRAVPRYVLLALMGQLGVLFPLPNGLGIGLPFGPQIMSSLGMHGDLAFFHLNPNQIFTGVFAGILGLGLSEAAYMAEIARAGILSVDSGQDEAACALGMSRRLSMRRIVLPQAMRVIVPPTGNEFIGMTKDTTLMTAIPVGTELFFQLSAIGSRTLHIFAVEIAACLWYLIICSILMYGQMHLERHFGRGFGAKKTKKPSAKDQERKAKMLGITGAGRVN
ncbi:MAG TPA: amino acid ABC transporter permease [Marmoricola sp.]|nr:amino acid ABC transporter permease [Marmoricola sp.]